MDDLPYGMLPTKTTRDGGFVDIVAEEAALEAAEKSAELVYDIDNVISPI